MLGKQEKRIAILPLVVECSDPITQERFSAISEELIANLSRFIGFSLISALSTRHLSSNASIEDLEKLKADYIVTGRLRDSTNRVRISIQLSDAYSGDVVYSEKMEYSQESLLDAEEEITSKLVHVLESELKMDILSYSYKKNIASLDAYECWLRGMELMRRAGRKYDLEARSMFESALKKDSKFAMAYAGLSLTYSNEWSCLLWDQWDESMEGAEKYAQKALDLDHNNYLALVIMARNHLYKGQYQKAEYCARKAIRMNPNDVSTLMMAAFVLLFLGYTEESCALYAKVESLNPIHQERYFPYGATIYFEAGRHEEADVLFKSTPTDGVWGDYAAFKAANAFYLSQFDEMKENWDAFITFFIANVYKGSGEINKEAINWQSSINPYKEGTRLDQFWNHILGYDGTEAQSTSVHSSQAELRFENELWHWQFGQSRGVLKDMKGLHDIHALILDKPNQISAMDLMGATVTESGHEVMDDKARKELVQRIKEVQAELEEAENSNQLTGLESLHKEYDQLLEYYSEAVGLNKKSRKIGDTFEKARSAVTWRIRSAVKKLSESAPDLGEHLSRSINTGAYCSYDSEIEVDWILE